MGNHNSQSIKPNQVYHSEIVGVYYTHNGHYLKSLPLKTELELHREPNNPHDRYAISVWHDNKKLGFIPKPASKIFFLALDDSSLTLTCLLGSYIPSSPSYSRSFHKNDDFQPERGEITLHSYISEIEWRPTNFVPEDGMAF